MKKDIVKKSDTKKSGFDAPTSGVTLPKGTTFKKSADGTLKVIPPKKK